MSRDIDLIKQLGRELDAEIEIRRDAGPELKHPHGAPRPEHSHRNSTHLLWWFVDSDISSLPRNLAITSDDDTVVRLYLSPAEMPEIPSTLFKLKSLELLFVYGGDFSFVPRDIQSLARLRVLFVGDNRNLMELPPELAQLPDLDETCFADLYLSTPPQKIADQGIDAIRNYFDSLEETEHVDYLYEAKMVLVGRGFAGKTSLVKKLTIPDYHLEETIKSTEGIAIEDWDLEMPLERSESFRFNIWDFGGQEKYDATHQFFITERTVYLFVTEARQESNYLDFDYWLNIVQMLGNNSPVIVVQNKIDVRNRSLPSEKYRGQFPNIVAFTDVSCADEHEDTIEQLRRDIRKAVQKLPQVGDKLPSEWVDIRRELAALNVDHITYEAYCEICRRHGLDEKKADFLSRYFHDLGVIVHHQNDPLLAKTVIVNPDWAVDGVYNVLDTRAIEQRNGRFSNSDLEKIWSDERYQHKRPELLALMKNYQICFQLPGSGTYIAPELLAANPVSYKPIKRAGRLTFIYRYTFMPAGLISRLIVKLHHRLDGENFWRHGLVARFEDARALVVEDDRIRQIRIDIEGPPDAQRNLLAVIRKEFDDIYREFNGKIEYVERIPCNCRDCLAAIENGEEPHYFDWRIVQRYAREPIEKIRCHSSFMEVNVSTLMGGISDKPDPCNEFGPAAASRGTVRQESAQQSTASAQFPAWQMLLSVAIGVGFLLLLLVIACCVAHPTEFQLMVFRVVLALGAAGFGALLPGFFEVEYRSLIRAGGAVAFFVAVLYINPPSLIHEQAEPPTTPATVEGADRAEESSDAASSDAP